MTGLDLTILRFRFGSVLVPLRFRLRSADIALVLEPQLCVLRLVDRRVVAVLFDGVVDVPMHHGEHARCEPDHKAALFQRLEVVFAAAGQDRVDVGIADKAVVVRAQTTIKIEQLCFGSID